MRYFNESDREKKEKRLSEQPKWAQRLFRNIPTIHDMYDDQLIPYISKDSVLLDAGCGKKGIMNKYRGRFKYSVGIDLSLSAIKMNDSLDSYAQASLSDLPFRDGTFDIIISQWAVEHIEDPAVCFREFYRVLKKGGGVIVVTNSIYNPLMFFSSVFPEKIRDAIKKRLLPPEIEEDTFPTYYNCNTLAKSEEVFEGIGFTKVFDSYVGDASFFIFSRLIFPILLFYEKLTDIPFLRKFKMHTIVHYRK
ncbi:MAG: hypothetical protein A2X93_09550 [Deltaproteobacteria bacterium GWC2_56_8]|nr:MAG: hypothetical protein A2X99_05990 [Deltaproteobacteria bacterium GWB2_55_19]OGP33213.1 MAG: hypothetical protein A2X93_09550 [Deltaproteobacteria bacterium GWC2_56_8]HAO94103.1 hypothetical protein [Deltaproteobacteria bacterium]